MRHSEGVGTEKGTACKSSLSKAHLQAIVNLLNKQLNSMGFMARAYIPQHLGGEVGDHYELEDSLGQSKNLFQNTIFFKKLNLP